MRNTQSRRTPKQQEIIETARRIISSKGVKSLTIHEIARELKLTDGALYRHFKSKRDIINMLIDDVEETLSGIIDSVSRENDEPLKILEKIFHSHLSYAEQRRGVTFIIITETLNLQDSRLQKKMMGAIDRYLARIRELLTKAMDSGEVRKDIDLNSAGTMFFGMIQSMVTIWALNGYRHSLRRGCSSMFGLYKNGIVHCEDFHG